jgi:hypothetical protein
MTKVDDVEDKLGGRLTDTALDAAITHHLTGQGMSPEARLGSLLKALQELGLDAGFLAPARRRCSG